MLMLPGILNTLFLILVYIIITALHKQDLFVSVHIFIPSFVLYYLLHLIVL